MKIWIDLTNSPHINFFKTLIEDWEKNGDEVIITCRDLANTIDLIEQNGWEYHEVGGHAGAGLKAKLTYFPKRVRLLKRYLKDKKPDVAISHSSFYSPVAARFLGIPSIYINDNEHAKGNYLAFLFTTKIYMPEALKNLARKKYSPWLSKFVFYPGLKEGIYLSKSDLSQLRNRRESSKRKKMFVRPEPWTAQYYKGDKFFFNEFLLEASKDYDVFLLPRGKEQASGFKRELGNDIQVLEKPMTLKKIVEDCDVFIGAGGSMTRELALLNIPTISIYQGDLLEVDKFLIFEKFMIHEPNISIDSLEKLTVLQPSENISLMTLGQQAYRMILKSVNL